MTDDRTRGRDDHRHRVSNERNANERAADHAAIDRLAGDLLPALIAKLSATGLGEIEVREGSWRVRVRRPVAPMGEPSRRTSDRPSRAQPGHAGHGHPPAGFEGHRSAREGRPAAHSSNGSSPGLTAVGPGDGPPEPSGRPERVPSRAVATSPAVGIYQPRKDAGPGTRVRAGDRLGAVDMLGIPQEVVAPVDGLVGASLAEAGQPVEFGQDLVVIELAGRSPGDQGPEAGAPAGEA